MAWLYDTIGHTLSKTALCSSVVKLMHYFVSTGATIPDNPKVCSCYQKNSSILDVKKVLHSFDIRLQINSANWRNVLQFEVTNNGQIIPLLCCHNASYGCKATQYVVDSNKVLFTCQSITVIPLRRVPEVMTMIKQDKKSNWNLIIICHFVTKILLQFPQLSICLENIQQHESKTVLRQQIAFIRIFIH